MSMMRRYVDVFPSPTILCLFCSPERTVAAGSGLGGSHNNATRSRQHNLAVSNGAEHQRVRRLGRVSDLCWVFAELSLMS